MSVAAGRIRRVERPTDLLAQHAIALAERLADLNWVGDAAPLREVADGLTDAALIEAIERVGALANLVDAVGSTLAGVFAARSARGGEEPLAKRLGERSAPIAVAALGHVSVRRAGEWSTVGQALGIRRSLSGEVLPELHPVVSAAFDSGGIGIDAAGLITETLAAITPHRDLDQFARDEQFLVENALILTPPG
jgi:hypothetical protein